MLPVLKATRPSPNSIRYESSNSLPSLVNAKTGIVKPNCKIAFGPTLSRMSLDALAQTTSAPINILSTSASSAQVLHTENMPAWTALSFSNLRIFSIESELKLATVTAMRLCPSSLALTTPSAWSILADSSCRTLPPLRLDVSNGTSYWPCPSYSSKSSADRLNQASVIGYDRSGSVADTHRAIK